MAFTMKKKRKEVFAKAKSSLQAEGVEFPIHLDALVIQESTAVVNRVQSLKQSIEKYWVQIMLL